MRIRIRYLTWATPWFDYLLASPQAVEDVLAGTAWRVAQTIPRGSGPYVAVLRNDND